MDGYSSKRAIAGVGSGRRGSSLSFRDNHEERSIQYCNRLGCSTRLNSTRGTQMGNPEKLKLPMPSLRSTSSKATVGSSSRTFSSVNGNRKSQREQRNKIFLRESNSRQEEVEIYESSSRQEDVVILESDPAGTGTQMIISEPDDLESAVLQDFSMNAAEASRSRPVTSNSRPQKPVNRRTGSGNQDTSSSSSVRRSATSRNAMQVVKPASQGEGANAQRYGLRSLSCTSISDVLPSGCSSSDASRNRRMDSTRKRYTEGESSSARVKGTIASSNGGNSGSPRSGLSGPSISLLDRDRSLPQPVSRRTRSRPTSRDEVVSVRTQRSNIGESRMRLSEHGDDNTFSLPESLMIPPLPQPQFSVTEAATASSSRSFPTELTPVCQSSYGRPGSSRVTYRSRSTAHLEDGDTRMFRGPLVDRDGYRRFNMEGIAEVLLALERIEQDEELTYEQLMVLETNLFLGGISFQDQHRDMRLDIDNMSYEELLALEEKMGTVSTALSEEALSSCLKKSIYMPISLSGVPGGGDDDVKCSICQEEYVVGDKVGKLGCDHRYHVACIHQWLRQKNWCPICKASVSPS